MWKEAVVTYFEVLSQNLHGKIEEYHENLSHDSRIPGKDMNQGSSEYETGVLTTGPRRSVTQPKQWKSEDSQHESHDARRTR
jgi:hypothetical protein